MRISDWSSDVCSSDLRHVGAHAGAPGYEITRADLEQAARVAGIAIRRGDAVLVRTGWGRHWDDGTTYLDFEGGMPGPGVEAIDWLCSLAVQVVGSDNISFASSEARHGGQECVRPCRSRWSPSNS